MFYLYYKKSVNITTGWTQQANTCVLVYMSGLSRYGYIVISRLSAHARLKITAKKRGWTFTRRSHLYV